MFRRRYEKFRKRLAKMGVAAASAVALTASMAAAQPNITTELNGRQMSFDQPPVMEQGRVLVPLRGIFESLGADVLYNSATRSIKATGDSNTVELSLGSRQALVNGRQVYLDVPANTIMGRTMVPLRFVSEALGADVRWLPATKTVAISHDDTTVGQNPDTNPPVSSNVEIDSVVHNGRRSLNVGDTLKVTMIGDAGGRANFSLLGAVENVAMREVQNGRYEGELQVGPGMDVQQGTLVANLTVNGRQTQTEADRAVTIATTSYNNGGNNQNVSLMPQPGSQVQTNQPYLQADFNQQLQSGTIQMTLNGQTVQPSLSADRTQVSFRPGYALPAGQHEVKVQGLATNNTYLTRTWNFVVPNTVGNTNPNNPGYSNAVSVSNLRDGITVPGVFNVQGQTSPYTKVVVEAQSQRNLIPGVIGIRGRTMTSSTVSDANGNYDIQLDASNLPSNSNIDLTVSSVDNSGNTADTVQLDVIRR